MNRLLYLNYFFFLLLLCRLEARAPFLAPFLWWLSSCSFHLSIILASLIPIILIKCSFHSRFPVLTHLPRISLYRFLCVIFKFMPHYISYDCSKNPFCCPHLFFGYKVLVLSSAPYAIIDLTLALYILDLLSIIKWLLSKIICFRCLTIIVAFLTRFSFRFFFQIYC